MCRRWRRDAIRKRIGREVKHEPNEEVLNDLVISSMLKSTTNTCEGS